jgi:hypothetical protein
MKKILLFLCLSFCLFAARSQSTAYFKVANTGTLMKIEKVSTGGYITLGTDSNFKLQIIRWDNNFNPLWFYKFPDANLVAFNPQVAEANDGSFFMLARSNAQSGSAMVTKFSSAGLILWQRDYYVSGGSLSAYALSKAVIGDSGFLIGGNSPLINNFIIKCDQDGNIQWQNQYYYTLASGGVTAWSILPDGNTYVVSSGYNTNSLLTFRIDMSGTILSHSAYTYTTMQIIPTRMVKLNSTNGYAILGNYNNSNNNQTQFLAILDNSLSLTSFNELTISGYDQFELHDITAINNGQNLILDGSIYDNSAFYIATMNVSNTGSIVWKWLAAGNAGPNYNVEFRGVTALGNSTVHAGYGYNEGAVVSIMDSAGNGLCNTISFNCSNVFRTLTSQSALFFSSPSNAVTSVATYLNNTNVFLNQYFYCGSIPTGLDDAFDINSVNIFPNPASREFRIQNAELRIEKIEMYDVLGEKVLSDRLTANSGQQVTIDVSSLPSGIYYLRLKGDGKETTQKVAVQH